MSEPYSPLGDGEYLKFVVKGQKRHGGFVSHGEPYFKYGNIEVWTDKDDYGGWWMVAKGVDEYYAERFLAGFKAEAERDAWKLTAEAAQERSDKTEAERDALSSQLAVMREALKKLKRGHDEIEDCWYSCPAAENYCGLDKSKECMCGADRVNTIIDSLLSSSTPESGK